MLFAEQIADNPWLLLSSMQVAAHGAHELCLMPRSALPYRIGLDILVEQLIGVEFRAIAWQQDQAQACPLPGHKLFHPAGLVHGVSVHDQIDRSVEIGRASCRERAE